jgi:ADP-ribose pyrophosphatase YjhB (NUDIX family)
MIKAVGTIFLSLKTNRILLGLRSEDSSHPLTWSFFGGKVEEGETLGSALERELKEELINFPKIIKTIPLDNFVSNDDGFNYASFVSIINNEFHPELNDEHVGYAWVNIGAWPKPLHAGTKLILQNKNNIKKLDLIINRRNTK